MDIDNKPLDTNDEIQESNESQDGNLEEIFDESGNEDVGSESESQDISLDQINHVTGRQFKSLEDFQKHYKNLNSLVGDQKRAELEKKARELEALKASSRDNASPGLAKEVEALKAEIAEDKFLRANPAASDHLDLVRSVAKAKGIPMDKAWSDHVRDVAEGHAAYKKEKEIGVESKQRINPQTTQRLNTLVKEFRETGTEEARDRLVAAWLGQK